MQEKNTEYYLFPDVDAEKLMTDKVQETIDRCYLCGGGTVRFTKGTYVLSTVFLKSDVSIVLEEGVELLGSLKLEDYEPEEKVDYPLYQDASHSFFNCSMFVGLHCKNIRITGPGKIDMRSVWDEDGIRADAIKHRGAKCIALKECRDIEVSNLEIYNATNLAIYFAGCENVEIDSVKMRVHIDGISPDNSKNVVIRNCDVESGDDGIVFKSSFTLNRFDICKNIVVENCKVKSRCNPLKFGTETNGGFEDIIINNVYIYDSLLSGIALESVDGAIVKNIHIKDIQMKNILGAPIFVHIGKRMRAPEGTPIGSIENITIENVTLEGPYQSYETLPNNYKAFVANSTKVLPNSKNEATWQISSNVCGLKERPLKNITLKNIRLKVDGGATEFEQLVSETPLLAYPESFVYGRILPAFGIYFRYVEGLTLENVQVSTYRDDVRQPFVFENVNGLTVLTNALTLLQH